MIEFAEDTWSVIETTSTDNDIHPNKEIDFNLYTEDGKIYITFYGWDKENNQVDTNNIKGKFIMEETNEQLWYDGNNYS